MTAADHPVSPEDLMAYLDGELPLAQAAIVQAHLAGCDGCQRSTSDLRGVSRDLARWPVESPPSTLTAPRPPAGKTEGRRMRLRWLLKPAVALATLILVAAGVAGVTYSAMSSSRIQYVGPFMQSASTPVSEAGEGVRRYSSKLGGAELEPPAYGGSSTAAGKPPEFVRPPAAQPKVTPSIARVASLRLTTRDFDVARSAVERIAVEMDGWFGNVSVSKSGPGRSLTAALHVPAARLDAALAALKSLGTVLGESLTGEDVTEQIVDVDTRLSNARNTEKRLLDLLQRRTGALEDVLAVEREMARVREEVERFDAQRKNLERRVTYATLELNVLEETPATLSLGPQPVRGRFRDASVTGVTEAVEMALGLALLVVRITPTLVVWAALLGWPVLLLVRWGRRQMNAER